MEIKKLLFELKGKPKIESDGTISIKGKVKLDTVYGSFEREIGEINLIKKNGNN